MSSSQLRTRYLSSSVNPRRGLGGALCPKLYSLLQLMVRLIHGYSSTTLICNLKIFLRFIFVAIVVYNILHSSKSILVYVIHTLVNLNTIN
jgi:hypothetical protein